MVIHYYFWWSLVLFWWWFNNNPIQSYRVNTLIVFIRFNSAESYIVSCLSSLIAKIITDKFTIFLIPCWLEMCIFFLVKNKHYVAYSIKIDFNLKCIKFENLVERHFLDAYFHKRILSHAYFLTHLRSYFVSNTCNKRTYIKKLSSITFGSENLFLFFKPL